MRFSSFIIITVVWISLEVWAVEETISNDGAKTIDPIVDEVIRRVDSIQNKMDAGLQMFDFVLEALTSFESAEGNNASCEDNSREYIIANIERLESHPLNILNHLLCEGTNKALKSILNSTIVEIRDGLEGMTNYTKSLLGNESEWIDKTKPVDCFQAKSFGFATGVTKIYPRNLDSREVYCEQDAEGGGWMAIVRRMKQDQQLSFEEPMRSYIEGFGNPGGEYWLGLGFLAEISKDNSHEVMVTMAIGPEKAKSFYGLFRVGGADTDYTLQVGEYDDLRSTGGDSLSYNNGSKFTTYDVDNDGAWGGNCAVWGGNGGWWFNYCSMTLPTARYHGNFTAGQEADHFLEWRDWQGYYAYLTDFAIYIRPSEHAGVI